MEKEIENLIRIGLTQGEAKVYIALITLGSTTVGPLVKKSGIAYSNIYEVLQRLMHKGIVSYTIQKKRRQYQALKPSHLLDYVESKEKEIARQKVQLKTLCRELEQLHSFASEQKAEIFLGTKGLRSAYEKFITRDEHLYFFSYEKRYAKASDLFYFSAFDLWKNTSMKGITNKRYCALPYYRKNKDLLNIRFAEFPIPGNIDISKEKLLIVSWEHPVVAILIHSESVAESFRRYFHEIWRNAGH